MRELGRIIGSTVILDSEVLMSRPRTVLLVWRRTGIVAHNCISSRHGQPQTLNSDMAVGTTAIEEDYGTECEVVRMVHDFTIQPCVANGFKGVEQQTAHGRLYGRRSRKRSRAQGTGLRRLQSQSVQGIVTQGWCSAWPLQTYNEEIQSSNELVTTAVSRRLFK